MCRPSDFARPAVPLSPGSFDGLLSPRHYQDGFFSTDSRESSSALVAKVAVPIAHLLLAACSV
jgi:hypothetical protein